MAERRVKYEEDPEKGVLTKIINPGTEKEVRQEMNLDDLPDNAKTYLLFYGAKQKLSDCHSGIKDAGEIANITSRMWEQLKSGEFKRVAEGGQPRGFELTVKALAKVKQISEDQAREKLSQFLVEENDSDEVAKVKRSTMTRIRQSQEIKDAIADIKGEKQKGLDDLLSQEVAGEQ